MEAIMEQFRQFDFNGDGTISRLELRKVLQALDSRLWTDKRVNQLVASIDRNGDGVISFEEFLSWCYHDQAHAKEIVKESAVTSAVGAIQAKHRAAQAAARSGDFVNAIRLLEEHPEVINMQHHKTGDTLLHQAALQGDIDAIGDLLLLGADQSIVNQAGETPYQVAKANNNREAARFLKKGGWPQGGPQEPAPGEQAAAPTQPQSQTPDGAMSPAAATQAEVPARLSTSPTPGARVSVTKSISNVDVADYPCLVSRDSLRRASTMSQQQPRGLSKPRVRYSSE